MTPTSRSLDLLRKEGWTAQVVEQTIRGKGVVFKRDLFSCIDIICLRDGVTMGVQTTSASNISSRIRKIAECPQLPEIRKAAWRIEVHGWSKRKGRWQVRREDVS